MKRQELKSILQSREGFKNYVNDKMYPETGLDGKELEIAFLGKKAAYEQKNTDISDKQKLMSSYEKSMEQQREQLQLLGVDLEKMAEKWDLSPELSYVISHQIEPFNCDDDKIMLVKIVYLANVIDNILTDGDEDLEYKDSILDDFGLNDSVKYEQVVSDLRK
jgi:hypothetical protein